MPEQTAYKLAHDPNDKAWKARLKLMAPVSQAAIKERIKEIRFLNRPGKVEIGPGGVPFKRYDDEAPLTEAEKKQAEIDYDANRPFKQQRPQQPPRELHDALQFLTMGPEGARQLNQPKEGLGAQFSQSATQFASGLLDPESLAFMLGGGPVARAGGPAVGRLLAYGFGGLAGKSAFEKFNSGNTGGGIFDLILGAGVIGTHEALSAKSPKTKGPPPPNPTTAQVHEPSGPGPDSPSSTGTAPPNEPPPGPKPGQSYRDYWKEEYSKGYQDWERRNPGHPPPEPPPSADPGAWDAWREAGRDWTRRAEENFKQKAAQDSPPRPEPHPGPEPHPEPAHPSGNDAGAWDAYEEAHARWRDEDLRRPFAKPRPEAANSRPSGDYGAEERARDRQERQERAKNTEQKRREQARSQWDRKPGEPDPPSRPNASGWEEYRRAHAEWRARTGSTPEAKRPSETYQQWGERRGFQTRNPSGGDSERSGSTGSQQPDTPYVPIDIGTPHPEVDRFNEHATRYAPNIGETSDIVAAKTRLQELVGKNKLTVGEKAERVRLDNKINTHITSLQDFAKRYKEATGKDPGIKIGTWSDKTSPAGRTEILDKIRQSLRAGSTTFEKMFPGAPKPENVSYSTEEFFKWLDDPGRVKYEKFPEGVFKAAQEFRRKGPGTFSDGQIENARATWEKLDKLRRSDARSKGFNTSAVVPEHLSTDVSRETKPRRFSALEDENAKSTQDLATTPESKEGAPAGLQESQRYNAEGSGSVSGGGEFSRVPEEGVRQSDGRYTKLPTREHRGIISQLFSTSGPKGIYRPASRNLYLNPRATEILKDILGGTDFGAATLSPKFNQVDNLARQIERESSGSNTDILERRGLADAVREAAKNNPGGSVIFQPYYPPGEKIPYKKFSIHENTHLGQHSVRVSMSSVDPAVGENLLTPDQEQGISEIPGWDKAEAKLRKYGYDTGQIHAEMPAFLASGDHKRLGLSDKQKDDILFRYADHIWTNYGADAVATLFEKAGGTAVFIRKSLGGTPVGKTVPAPLTAKSPLPGNPKADFVLRPLPPKSGSGPVGRVAHHGTETLNAMNKFEASTVSGPVRAEMMSRDLYDGLSEGEKDLLGEYLVGRRLYGDSVDPNASPETKTAAEAHLRYMDQSELTQIEANPRIKDAIDKWDTLHQPVLDEISGKSGISAQAIGAKAHHYFPLVSPDFIHAQAGSGAPSAGGYASWESKARPQSSGRRKQAKYSADDYSTDVAGVLRTVLRLDEPKAALNDLWRTLDTEGLIAFQPSGAAGNGWVKPEGYVGDEIQGKFSSMPDDLKALYGGRGKVYLPQDVVQTMGEITAPKTFSGDRGLETASRISRALISTTLGLNIPAVPFHIYRQTAMFRASTALADAKKNPATVLANAIPVVGTLVKGAVIASRNADDPIYREVYRHLVEINAISPRSMEGLTVDYGRLPLRERWNAYLHDSMFGVPHGKGVNGWAGRIAVEAYLARGRFEHSDSPERDREYIAQFGAYMRRLSPKFDMLAEFNPFIRTHGPRIKTSLKLTTGDTGLKTPRNPGESETTFRMREALDRIGSFAMAVALPVAGLVVLNKVISGKWPWENGKGHELDLNLGHGNWIPVGRMLTELQPAVELSGEASRMHRARGESGGSIPSGMPKMGGSKLSAPAQNSPVLDRLQNVAIGAGNTVIGMGDSPAMNAGAALLNKRMYLTYDKQKKGPDLMNLSPASASAAQKALNTVTTITGTSTMVPTQGYADDGQHNIARSILDYLSQGAVKTDSSHSKGMKPSKVRRRK